MITQLSTDSEILPVVIYFRDNSGGTCKQNSNEKLKFKKCVYQFTESQKRVRVFSKDASLKIIALERARNSSMKYTSKA